MSVVTSSPTVLEHLLKGLGVDLKNNYVLVGEIDHKVDLSVVNKGKSVYVATDGTYKNEYDETARVTGGTFCVEITQGVCLSPCVKVVERVVVAPGVDPVQAASRILNYCFGDMMSPLVPTSFVETLCSRETAWKWVRQWYRRIPIGRLPGTLAFLVQRYGMSILDGIPLEKDRKIH